MNYLADTHILLWIMAEDRNKTKLSKRALEILDKEDTELYYSFINVWEVSLKHIRHPETFFFDGKDFEELCRKSGFKLLETKPIHAVAMESLVFDNDSSNKEHKDPFDRLLLAQAKVENMMFLTHDHLLTFYNEENVVEV